MENNDSDTPQPRPRTSFLTIIVVVVLSVVVVDIVWVSNVDVLEIGNRKAQPILGEMRSQKALDKMESLEKEARDKKESLNKMEYYDAATKTWHIDNRRSKNVQKEVPKDKVAAPARSSEKQKRRMELGGGKNVVTWSE